MESNLNRKSAHYLYAIVSCHQEMQRFLDKGFRNHESIFPIINFHLFQASASRTTLDKFVTDFHKDIKRIETRCNQIDTLQAKMNKLTPSSTAQNVTQRGMQPIGSPPPPGSS
jgi:hypothetical protein